MRLVDLPFTELLEAFAQPAPTPGGGSGAAVAGALGAALLTMVAALPKTRSGQTAERDALEGALHDLRRTRDRLVDLVDADAAAYEAVVAAYRLPKSSDQEKATRAEAVQAALRGATEVPMEVARSCRAVAQAGLIVAAHGHAPAASDTGVALALVDAAVAGAALNVRANLGSITDAGFVAGAGKEIEGLTSSIRHTLADARAALGS